MQKFKPVITDQFFLLPPSIEDFVPAGVCHEKQES